MKIINATPHNISLSGITFKPSGKEVRVKMDRKHVGNMEQGEKKIPLYKVTPGILEGFEKPNNGELLVVSLVAKNEILRQYPDMLYNVASPGQLIRDDKGVVIGADGLDL